MISALVFIAIMFGVILALPIICVLCAIVTLIIEDLPESIKLTVGTLASLLFILGVTVKFYEWVMA